MTDSNIQKKGLGRGLSSLMGDVEIPIKENNNKLSDTRIPISKLRANPLQPRRLFNKESINELAASIKSKGLIQVFKKKVWVEVFHLLWVMLKFQSRKIIIS